MQQMHKVKSKVMTPNVHTSSASVSQEMSKKLDVHDTQPSTVFSRSVMGPICLTWYRFP